MNLLNVQRLLECATNHTWFLTLGITLKEGMIGKEVLFNKLTSLLHVLSAGIAGFNLHSVCEENKDMVPL